MPMSGVNGTEANQKPITTDLVGVPASVPAAFNISKIHIAPETVRLLPVEFIKRHRVLPFEIRNGILRVATAEPGNARVVDDIRLLSGLEVEEVAAPGTELLERIAAACQVTVEQMIENLNPSDGTAVE